MSSRPAIKHSCLDNAMYYMQIIMPVVFYGRQQGAFFNIRVFHSNAQSYRKTSISSVYRLHELQTKRKYGDRIREVELASFTPLVFSTTGGMGRKGLVFYRRLAELLSRHDSASYSRTLAWLRSTLFFFAATSNKVYPEKSLHLP